MISLSSDFGWKLVGCALRDTTEKLERMRVPILAVAAIAIACLSAHGQDTRSVTEPVVPEVCIVMQAALVAPHGIASQDELWVDTDRLQSAINHCGRGQAVELASDGKANAFLTGTLHLRGGVTLLLDKGVTLYGSRNPRDYDVRRGSCGIVDGSSREGCHALIEADHARGSAVMGEGVIDGRGGEPLLVDGVEQKASWWDLATQAQSWGHAHLPQLIAALHTGDFTVYQVTLRNSASDDLGFRNGNGLVAWGLKIDSSTAARDAGGIHPRSSRNITVKDSYIRSGTADIAISASRDVSILHNHFYGDGISIGRETRGRVSSVLVSDLSLDGSENGILIQPSSARGGVVKNITYDDVCIRGWKSPIMPGSSCEAKFVPFPGGVVVASAVPESKVQVAKLEEKKAAPLPVTDGDPGMAPAVSVRAPVRSAPAVRASQRVPAVRMRRVSAVRRTLRRCRRIRTCRAWGARHRLRQRRVMQRGHHRRRAPRGTAGVARALALQRGSVAGG